jgi:hypothetical protein
MKINYNNDIRERFIPISYDEILKGYLRHFDIKDRDRYQELSRAINLYYYYNFYDDLKQLKLNYQPFNPDSDTISTPLTLDEYKEREDRLFEEIVPLLNYSNYEILTQDMLESTINKSSPYGVEVSVDFDDFEEIQIYYRGESIQQERVKDPKKLYLRYKTITLYIYRRLFIIIKPKHIDDRAKEIALRDGKDIEKVKQKLKRQNHLLSTDRANKYIYIKIFKDIPQIDLEMLFPNTKVRMKLFDKLKLGVVGGGGTVGGGATLFGKLSAAAIDPISALLALGAFGGILWRQVKEVLFRRTHYMAQLAKNLYSHNISNNMGALSYIADMAKDEESKEVLLTSLFLLHQKSPISIDELDREIERYISKNYDIEMNFEISDGINKLERLGLIAKSDDKLEILNIDKCIERLEELLTLYR